jgi:hypothetical protein
MQTPHMPFNAQHAYIIASLCLFCTGHWFGGIISLGFALYVEKNSRDLAAKETQANLPDDELVQNSSLPPIGPLSSVDTPPHPPR